VATNILATLLLTPSESTLEPAAETHLLSSLRHFYVNATELIADCVIMFLFISEVVVYLFFKCIYYYLYILLLIIFKYILYSILTIQVLTITAFLLIRSAPLTIFLVIFIASTYSY